MAEDQAARECIDTPTKDLLTPICLSLINSQLAETTPTSVDEQKTPVTRRKNKTERPALKYTLASSLREQNPVLHFFDLINKQIQHLNNDHKVGKGWLNYKYTK